MAAWLTSTSFSHTISSSEHSINLSLTSRQQTMGRDFSTISMNLLHLLKDLCPSLGCEWLWKGLSHSHSTYIATDQLFDSAWSVSPLIQTVAPMWRSDTYFRSPTPWVQSSPTNTHVYPLVPSSYSFFCGSIYYFLCSGSLVCSQLRFFKHLCLKLCSWWTLGQRCTPCTPPPPPSLFLKFWLLEIRLLWTFMCVVGE